MKTLQFFSSEYLQQCKSMRADEIVEFLENFRLLHAGDLGKSRLISVKIPERLLEAFKHKARRDGVPYQSKIKQLMHAWLASR